MKKVRKSHIFSFILGALILGSVGVIAANYAAKDISFTPKNTSWKKEDGTDITNVKDALDNLYNNKTVCMLLSGTGNSIGAKYMCNPGDGILRNFYILSINNESVQLIMEKNLSDEAGSNKMMTWDNAMKFFDINNPGYEIKQSWVNVNNIDLPSAQDIANVGGIINFDVTTSTSRELYFGGNQNSSGNYAWLYNYLRGCGNYGKCSNAYPDTDGYPWGYWTKNLKVNDNDNAWVVNTNGFLDPRPVSDAARGVRPVITLSKSNLVG